MQGRHEIDLRNRASKDEYIKLDKLYFKFNSEFEIIIAGYPGKDCEEFKEKRANLKKYMQEKPLSARVIITEMMEHDSRIKGVNE